MTSATGPEPSSPSLTLAFRAMVTLDNPFELGEVDGVRKRIFRITGGEITGLRLSGRVLPGGADWQTILPDGTAKVFARYTLQAEDRTLIGVTNAGIRRGPPEVMQRLAAGEQVDPQLYYFRSTPSFEVAAGPHHWLGQNIFVCSAARYPDRVALDFYLLT